MPYPLLNNEPDLLARLCKGDSQAFSAFYAHYPPVVKQYISTIFTIPPPDIEDIIQDTFTALWAKKETLNGINSFKGYIFTMARNQTLMAIRRDETKRAIFRDISHRQPIEYNHVHDHMLYKFYTSAAREAVLALPEKTRRVFDMVTVYDLSNNQIASELNISVQMVRRHASNANRLIIKRLGNDFDGISKWMPVLIIIMLSKDLSV